MTTAASPATAPNAPDTSRPASATVQQLAAGKVGISRIIQDAESINKEREETLSDAFRDLDALMAKASELVGLAESITAKLSREQVTSTSTDAEQAVYEAETHEFREQLLHLGIATQVTQSVSSQASEYHRELARELVDLLKVVLPKYNAPLRLLIFIVFTTERAALVCFIIVLSTKEYFALITRLSAHITTGSAKGVQSV